jgi:hypothetical protein
MLVVSLKTWEKCEALSSTSSARRDGDFLSEVLGDVILNLAELSDGQAAAVFQRHCASVRVFLHEVRREELGERSDGARLARSPRGEHLGAGQADVPENFVAAEKVHHFHPVRLARIPRLECGQERVDRDVKRKSLELLHRRRFEAHFIRRA